MSELAARRTRLVFTTADQVRERGKLRAVVIEAQPYMAMVRLHGTRTAFPVSYAAVYHLAARLAVAEQRKEKAAKKKAIR
jgi:3-methyladenine DNA glycosylase Tag